jgi:hypothetical protein
LGRQWNFTKVLFPDHVEGLGRERNEIPERVVRTRRLRKATIGLHLHGVHQVGELHGVLDEEHRDVVAHEVPVAFLGVELHGEATHVARRIDRARTASHRRKPREHRRFLAHLGEDACGRVTLQRRREFEVTMRRGAARMDDALGDALVVEVGDLLAEDEVLQQRGAALACTQRVLVIAYRRALVRRHGRMRAAGELVEFVAVAAYFFRRFRRLGRAFRFADHGAPRLGSACNAARRDVYTK